MDGGTENLEKGEVTRQRGAALKTLLKGFVAPLSLC